jgi:rRNA maturation endonuclease Nob1
MDEETVQWSVSCDACEHEWMQVTPADSDPAGEETVCPECGSTLLDVTYAGRS